MNIRICLDSYLGTNGANSTEQWSSFPSLPIIRTKKYQNVWKCELDLLCAPHSFLFWITLAAGPSKEWPRLHSMLASRSRHHRPYGACSAGLIAARGQKLTKNIKKAVGRVGWIMVPKLRWRLTSINSGGILTTSYENGRDNKTAVIFQDFNAFCECWKWDFSWGILSGLYNKYHGSIYGLNSWKCLRCSRSWRNQTRKRLQGTNNCKCLWRSHLLWPNHDMIVK